MTTSTSEGYVDVTGHKIFYRTFGRPEKGTVLTLHGGPGATHDYMLPISDLARSGYRVVFYDMLGCGRSDAPEDISLYTLEGWSEEAEGVREALDLGVVDLLGHSLGGAIALLCALDHQQDLRSLTVSSGFASVPFLTSEIHRLESELPPVHLDAIRRAEETRQFKTDEYRRAVKEFMDLHYARGLQGEKNPPEHVYTLSRMNKLLYKVLWGPNEFTVTGSLKSWEISDRLSRIDVPCLITAGRFDEATPRVAEDLHRRISGSELVIFEASSHLAMLEERERYIQAVSAFLDRLPAKS